MNRTILVVLSLTGVACAGYHAGQMPEPKTPNAALEQLLAAVKAKDTRLMGEYWGNARGPWPVSAHRDSVLQTFPIFLRHDTYRIVDGPTVMGGNTDMLTYHVELQSPGCTRTQPFDVVKTKHGGFLVINVHLEAEGTVIPHCPRP